jgi:hypothetical protein
MVNAGSRQSYVTLLPMQLPYTAADKVPAALCCVNLSAMKQLELQLLLSELLLHPVELPRTASPATEMCLSGRPENCCLYPLLLLSLLQSQLLPAGLQLACFQSRHTLLHLGLGPNRND